MDSEMVAAFWQVGREIMEDEQKREKRAEYGKVACCPRLATHRKLAEL